MGMPMLLGAVAGLGAASLLSRKSGGPGGGSYQAIPYQPSAAATAAQTPIDVKKTETGTTNNQLMEEAREKERQAAILRQKKNAAILTSGLGASGVANTQKKELLGG